MKHSLTIALSLGILAHAEQLSLRDLELRPYDGTDGSKPIYLAINGTIYDVSASPSFYGPGGAYHHFTGRDASRAWVTECWDEPEQLTWRMDGIEAMFTPRYIDEEFEKIAGGAEPNLNLKGAFSHEELESLAKRSVERLGSVTDREKAERRAADAKEADQGVHDALAKWISFFANNDKYAAVGKVIYDQDETPPPPAICGKALEKRPLKGGKLDALMSLEAMAPKKAADEEEMPDFVKGMVGKNKERPVDNEQEPVKDEL